MKNIEKYKLVKRVLLYCILLFFIFQTSALANSSWHWVTISPMRVLPFAIVLTLTIETWGAAVFGKTKGIMRTFIVVAIANAASFVMPYFIYAYRIKFYGVGFGADWKYVWEKAFNSGPNYIVGFVYLILTLCVELPIAYLLLKNHSENKKQLFYTIIVVNVITTAVVAVMERILCRGMW